MITKSQIKRNYYQDSVRLMQISKELETVQGVLKASVIMATDNNKQLLEAANLLTPEISRAVPNDLVIVVQAESEEIVEKAFTIAEQLFKVAVSKVQTGIKSIPIRTLNAALDYMPDAGLVLISVPGAFAKLEVLRALKANKHVLLFSDHVSIEDEVFLKQIAKDKGLLMMGPGCGTAIINHNPLAFANSVRPGPIGLVAAAGTGLQEVSVLIHRAGSGISEAIGTGGRDLSETVGGIMMLEGMKLLEMDPDTSVIVLISKPPATVTMQKILTAIKVCGKPVVVSFIGGDPQLVKGTKAISTINLEDAAIRAVQLATQDRQIQPVQRTEELKILAKSISQNTKQKYVRGLYSGGTLCYEAMLVLQDILATPIYSNVPLKSGLKLPSSNSSREHTCIDFGEEEFTKNRPHPMIDPSIRQQRLLQEAADPETAVILLDVMLGYGSNPDPASALAPYIKEAKGKAERDGRNLPVVVHVVGTDLDPQNLGDQEKKLAKAGAILMPSNFQASVLSGFIIKYGRKH